MRTSQVERARQGIERVREKLQRTVIWGTWERMLETEFVDRSVALAGKAFVSFFPLAIVVAAFLPQGARSAIFATLTTRLGVRGDALALTKEAFVSADDIRRATGVLGLVMTFFFASSFTTALQRVYLRAWRRPRDLKVGSYSRGLLWLAGLLGFMTLSGALARALGSGVGILLFVVLTVAISLAWWWFTAWYLLLGHVRWRALFPTAVISTAALLAYAVSAAVWMPTVITENLNQFGFFGVSLGLVTWFSGASVCLIVGACAGPVLADDPGPVGRFIRGTNEDHLVDGAPPALAGPTETLRLRDAFSPGSDELQEPG